ncbi:MAG: hypothetical protein NC432_13135 [Roseburia sp.]|nr:hypothetical protein [Roseburia sp.]MCM1099593.1 hypothetical protein [Ruminococcus flavefaciens]
MEIEEIRSVIRGADLVLVGLGEEFQEGRRLRESEEYQRGCRQLREAGEQWLLPAWNEYCSGRLGEPIESVLQRLAGFLVDKNYFIVAVAADSRIRRTSWKPGRLVMPCGSGLQKQCRKGCGGSVDRLEDQDGEKLQEFFRRLYEGESAEIPELGKCPQCGEGMILNNIFAENYDEQGYLEEWKQYMKWLQGTLNRKLVALELGAGMQFPGVIRWPFEKAVFFNQQAFLIRVNERLFQLTEELGQKGCGIPQNAIDWLEIL